MKPERKVTSLPALPANARRRYRSLFLSDIHLGTRGCQANRLLSFLERHECDALYLVGDIVDGWRLKSGFYWPLEHTRVLKKFLAMAASGTRVTYVTGNHDEFLRRYTDMEVGNIQLVDEAEHVTATGERLLVTHGDAYDVITRYHRWLAFLGDIGYGFLLELNRLFNWGRKRFGYGYFSLSAWVKHRVKKAVSYIGDYEQAVSWTCRQRGFSGVVCGHIHHAEITDYGEVRYMNCGDWVESCTALAERADGSFEIVRWASAESATVEAPAVVPLRLPRRASA
jgi:UDP-2,3-diacylglucosamine pyrophosphatase LpxH